MKIFDSILFFNELDILDIRLNLLDEYVDYFIISECDHTFSGQPKKFIFEENKDKFEKFAHKIIHIKHYDSNEINDIMCPYEGRKKEIFEGIIDKYNKIKNTPRTDGGKTHWCLDYLHREFVKLGMDICEDEDLVIFSDADEVPNLEILSDLKKIDKTKKYCFLQDNNNYYVNNISSTNWKGNILLQYKDLKDTPLNDLRIESRRHNSDEFIYLENGGWHLSFMGGVDRIKEKIKSYGHQEFNNSNIINSIENNLKENKDLFFRTSKTYKSNTEEFYFDNMKTVNIEDYFPKKVVDLIKKEYIYLIK
jgi:beta-1,4-mannosyl-glycoprotein beta-1,4-N-acetylglucosaminyltransferase